MAPEPRAGWGDRRADIEAIGQRVYELRTARRWGAGTLAAQAGLHWTYIRQIEGGKRNITVATLLKLADAFDVDPCKLLPPHPARQEPKAGR